MKPRMLLPTLLFTACFASRPLPSPPVTEASPLVRQTQGPEAAPPPPEVNSALNAHSPYPDEVDRALTSDGYGTIRTKRETDLQAVDPSDGIDAGEADVVAETYLYELSGSLAAGCGGLTSQRLRNRRWIWTVFVGVAGDKTADRVVVDARTGGVWGLGPRFKDYGAFKRTVEQRTATGK
jgi:hypothetical protein